MSEIKEVQDHDRCHYLAFVFTIHVELHGVLFNGLTIFKISSCTWFEKAKQNHLNAWLRMDKLWEKMSGKNITRTRLSRCQCLSKAELTH